MSTNKNYFSTVNRLFWVLIMLVALFALLKLNPGIYDGTNIARDIIVEDSLSKIVWEGIIVSEDSSKISDSSISLNDYLLKKWEWKSFDNKNYILNFKVKNTDLQTSKRNRETSDNFSGELYSEMFLNDNVFLEDMITGYKKLIKENQLDYFEALNLVATSIQSIKYTWVLTQNPACGFVDNATGNLIPPDNCSVPETAIGCCDNVMPFGVYSPLEFAVNRTGDCDTRSLFAFTVLKRLGYDVAVMVSKNEQHSVLGVSVPSIPSDGKRGNIGLGRNYFLWELTAYGPQLGQRIEGNDWTVALN